MSPLFFLPCIYLAAVGQAWLSPRWEVLEAAPNLLVLAAFLGLTQLPSRRGILMAAVAGLASDLNSPLPLGVGMAVFACAAYGVVCVRQRIRLDGFVARLGVVWFAAGGITLTQGLFTKFSGVAPASWSLLMQRSALVALYTLIVGVPFLIFVYWRKNPQRQFA